MTPYNFAILLFAFCSFLLSLMIWFKRQDEIGKIYFIYTCFVTIWGIGYSFLISHQIDYNQALLGGRISNASSAFIGPTWYHFCWLYGQKEKKSLPKLIYFFYFIAGLIVCFSFSRWFITRLVPSTPFEQYPAPGLVYHFFTTLFFTCVILAFTQLFKQLKLLDARERKSHLILIIAKLTGYIGGALTFLPVYQIHFPQYGIFFMPFYPFITAYLISREKIFDIVALAEAAHKDKLASIGILSASINHELRNPLYIIKNFSESLLINNREGVYKDLPSLQGKLDDTLERILRQSNQAMKIIGRLTAFARKKPDQDFKMVPTSLPTLLVDLDILIRPEIEFHKIEIIQEIPQDLPQLFVDPSHLEEILLNLILNAYQILKNYQIKAPKKIVIRAVAIQAKAQITIQDNGPGISPEDLPNIFKPFYTKKQEGLGLGLYITKQLVEKNKGSMKVESKPQHGAAFILEFQKA